MSAVIPVAVSVTINAGDTGSAGALPTLEFDVTPKLVHVTERDTTIEYDLTPDTPQSIVFDALYTSDFKYQLEPYVISNDGRTISILHRNTESLLINVSLRVKDTQTGALGSHDPQITNDDGGG